VSHLQRLRDAKTLNDVARILSFTPSGLSYVLYKVPDSLKYKGFEIPKRGGGKRHIKALESILALLQQRLARLLYDCLAELETATPPRRSLGSTDRLPGE
jgi:RNA-directed DNA polymerase